MILAEPVQHAIDLAWGDRTSDRNLQGWHGFATRKQGIASVVTLLFQPKSNPEPLKQRFADLHGVHIEVWFIPQFRQFADGKRVEAANPLEAGNLVFACGGDCKKSERHLDGTIGAFVRLRPCKPGDSIWLLSCNHILIPDPEPRTANLAICGAGGRFFADKVVPGTKPDGTFLDAALALLTDPTGLDPTYDQKLAIRSVDPVGNIPAGTLVRKQGYATGVTCGIVARTCDRIAVLKSSGLGEVECLNDIVVGSIVGRDPFVTRFDSGSLMVSNGQPAGILHSMSNTPNPVERLDRDLGEVDLNIPYGLATSFDLVIRSLSLAADPTKQRKLEMLPLKFPVQPC